MPERRFPDGVIIDLSDGFELIEITTLHDEFPRMLVTVDFDSALGRQIIEATRPKEAE